MRVCAEFAFYSVDAAGLRQATLVGGTILQAPGVTVEVKGRERQAKITRMDYLEKKAWIDQPWPRGVLDGQAVEVGTAKHLTSYMIRAVEPASGSAVITFDKGMDYYASLISDVDETKGEVLCGLGFPTDDGAAFPGLSDDVVVSNGQGTKFWRGQYRGGTREDGFRFRLDGAVKKTDFGLPAGKLRVWEIGVGDTVRIPVHVSLRRVTVNRYELQADTAFQMKLTGAAKLRVAADGKTWKDLTPDKEGWVSFGEGDLGNGRLLVETAR